MDMTKASGLKFAKSEPRVLAKRRQRLTLAEQEREARIAVRKRDHGKCRIPGCKDRAEHLHHIVFRSHSTRLKWRTENLCSLCPGHHGLVHAGQITISGNADDELIIQGDKKLLSFKL